MSHEMKVLLGAVTIIAVAVLAGLGLAWYQAGIQREVYHRQGVEMTQWEVFCGAKPVERAFKPAVEKP